MKIGFSAHAEFRMKLRNVSKEEVINAIKYPLVTIKKHGKYYFHKPMDRGKIEVVVDKTEKDLNVVTVYWI